jgi:hypothetical protein
MKLNHSGWRVFVLMLLAAAASASAAEIDEIVGKLEDARYTCNAASVELRKRVIDDLNARIEQGDRAAASKIRQEINAFKRNDEWPPSANEKLCKDMEKINRNLAAAYEKAIGELEKQGFKTEATARQKERDALKSDRLPKYEPLATWWTVGSVWTGRWVGAEINNKPDPASWPAELKITRREGSIFQGRLNRRNAGQRGADQPVNGRIKDDQVTFINETTQPKIEYAGEFDGQKVTCTFDGVGPRGRHREGTMTLTRRPRDRGNDKN